MTKLYDSSVIARGTSRPLLLVAAFAFLLVRISRPPVVYDEGLILAGADRILLGEVPFRDFWNTHPPAQIWLVAGLFRLFGESMVVLRVYDAAVKAGIALVLYLWARRLSDGAHAGAAACILATIWLEFFGSFGFGYTAFPALLLSLVSLGWLIDASDAETPARARRLIAGAGLCVGLAALFRLDFGAYAALTAVATLAVAATSKDPRPRSMRVRGTALALTSFGAAALAPAAVAVAVLAAQGVTTARLVDVLVTYPARVFPQYRGLPLPDLTVWRLAYYVPVWVAVAGLARGGWLMHRRDGSRASALAWFSLSALALVSIPQARTRADMVHQAPVLLPSAALAAALWFSLWRRRGPARAIACALVPVVALTYAAAPVYSLARPGSTTATRAHGLPRAAGVAIEPDQAAAVRAVRQRTSPGDAIYVGNTRHDHIIRNDALFYFLAGRRYATAYHNLLPGLATRDEVQREIVEQLRATRPRCVVLCARFDGETEPNASSLETGSRRLDDDIRQGYVFSVTIGAYQIGTAR
jgi:hypothetical protein